MSGPVASLIKYFFFEQLSTSYIRAFRFPNREHSKVFRAMFVLFLCATQSFIFVSNTKLVHRRQPYRKCTVGRTQSFCLLKLVVRKVTLGFKRLRMHYSRTSCTTESACLRTTTSFISNTRILYGPMFIRKKNINNFRPTLLSWQCF